MSDTPPLHSLDARCGRCGYDLRGLPGPICPECGGDLHVVGVRRAGEVVSASRVALATLYTIVVLIGPTLLGLTVAHGVLPAQSAENVQLYISWAPKTPVPTHQINVSADSESTLWLPGLRSGNRAHFEWTHMTIAPAEQPNGAPDFTLPTTHLPVSDGCLLLDGKAVTREELGTLLSQSIKPIRTDDPVEPSAAEVEELAAFLLDEMAATSRPARPLDPAGRGGWRVGGATLMRRENLFDAILPLAFSLIAWPIALWRLSPLRLLKGPPET